MNNQLHIKEARLTQILDRYLFSLCDVVCIKLRHCLFTTNY